MKFPGSARRPQSCWPWIILWLTRGDGTGATLSGFGGGIYNEGTLTLTACTVSGNSASSGGGGIYSRLSTSSLTMDHCTVTGNNALFGGGLVIDASSGSVSLVHCTLSNNTGTGGTGGIVLGTSSSLTLRDTILAGNFGGGSDRDLGGSGGTVTLPGNNMVGVQSSSYSAAMPLGTPNVNGDYVGISGMPVDAMLGPLANNGGPTNTMALLTGSLAINAATSSTATSDQRGVATVGVPDIGAFEKNP